MLYYISINSTQYEVGLTWTYLTRCFRKAYPRSGRGFTVYALYNERVMPVHLIVMFR